MVQEAHDAFEVDAAAAGRAKVPLTPVGAELRVAAEHADRLRHVGPPHVLDVHVPDARPELAQEAEVVDALITEVRGVEVEAERRMRVDRSERAARRRDVEGDLGGMHLEREPDAVLRERVEDRPPTPREVGVARLDELRRGRRERVEHVPDRAPREAVDDEAAVLRQSLAHRFWRGVEEAPCRARGALHLVGGAAAHTLGIAVAPDRLRQDRAMSLVDAVAHGLTDEVRRERVAREPVVGEQLPVARAVGVVLERGFDVEVIAPAGELEPVVAERLRFGGERLEREIGPLAGEEAKGSAEHGRRPRESAAAGRRAG